MRWIGEVQEVGPGLTLRYILSTHVDEVNTVSWSPNGWILASASDDASLCLWNTTDGTLLRQITGHNDMVISVAWSPDGNTLASGSEDTTVRLWDPTTGRELRLLDSRSRPVTSVAWRSGGDLLAVGSEAKSIHLWDMSTYIRRFTLHGHDDWVNALSWAPDGTVLASASDDRKIRLWNPDTGLPIREFRASADEVNHVTWSPDGRYIAACFGDFVRIWDAGTLAYVATLEGHRRAVDRLSFSYDSVLLASQGEDALRLWRCDTWQQISQVIGPFPKDSWLCTAFHPSEYLLTSPNSSNRRILVWEVDLPLLMSERDASSNMPSTEQRRHGPDIEVGPSDSMVMPGNQGAIQPEPIGVDPIRLLTFLEGLDALSLNRVVLRLGASQHVASHQPVLQRSHDLFLFAQSTGGPGLLRLVEVLRELFPNAPPFR